MYEVVIPIQTIGFYNLAVEVVFAIHRSCHTYPNDRLLQLYRLYENVGED